jgi:serine/threonine protein phosphatase 1
VYAFHSTWEPAPRRTPPGTTLLAVGDVHGCAAHLRAMLKLLGSAIRQARDQGRRCELVMVGDYVDRGPDSLGVLDGLGGIGTALGVPAHLLLGNHDQLLDAGMALMPDPAVLELWCANGGLTTLAECGIRPRELEGADPAEIAARLRARLGPKRIRLLRDLAPAWRAGGYLFVRAGVDPSREPEAHSVADLVWMREPFLAGAGWRHAFAVVHGHTPGGPEVLPHRVGIDSGCFFTGVLTAVELADDRLRFHGVASDPRLRALKDLVGPDQRRRFTTPQPIGR